MLIVDLATSDADFLLLFNIFNPTNQAKKLLTWATPLDVDESKRLNGKVFVVHTAAGDELEYVGADVKRSVDPVSSASACIFSPAPMYYLSLTETSLCRMAKRKR